MNSKQFIEACESGMNENNPFCENCKEKHCLVSLDGTCAMIREYLKTKEEK